MDYFGILELVEVDFVFGFCVDCVYEGVWGSCFRDFDGEIVFGREGSDGECEGYVF